MSTAMQYQEVTKHSRSHLYTTGQAKQRQSDTKQDRTNEPTFVIEQILARRLLAGWHQAIDSERQRQQLNKCYRLSGMYIHS
jgi:hypothetical protein